MGGAAQVLIPQPDVLVKGRPLTEAQPALRQVSVEMEMGLPSMFTLQLINREQMPGEIRWVDEDLFDIGTAVIIKTQGNKTQGKDSETLIYGQITGLEPDFNQDETPMLIVRGYDLRHRLMRGQKTCTFTNMTDSEIVAKIARDNNLKSNNNDIADTKIKLEYVLQHNQSDLEFLQARADRLGYELGVSDQNLLFRPPQNTSNISLSLTLTYPKNLTRFAPRLSSINQTKEVQVRSWDMREKNPIVGRFGTDARPPQSMGRKLGTKEARERFGDALQVVVNQPTTNQEEADQMAKGQFQKMALGYIIGEGECPGNPKLQAGRMIEIKGVGTRFGGRYYVTAATHTFGPYQNYRTEFTVKRNAHS